ELAQDRRAGLIADWLGSLRRQHDVTTMLVVLREFEPAVVPVVLENDLVIDALTDEELSIGLSRGARLSPRGGSELVNPPSGVRPTHASPLFIDDTPPEKTNADVQARDSAWAKAERVLLALRVFKPGRVSAAGSFSYSQSSSLGVFMVQGGVSPY